jgi:ribosomal protein S25
MTEKQKLFEALKPKAQDRVMWIRECVEAYGFVTPYQIANRYQVGLMAARNYMDEAFECSDSVVRVGAPMVMLVRNRL